MALYYKMNAAYLVRPYTTFSCPNDKLKLAHAITKIHVEFMEIDDRDLSYYLVLLISGVVWNAEIYGWQISAQLETFILKKKKKK